MEFGLRSHGLRSRGFGRSGGPLRTATVSMVRRRSSPCPNCGSSLDDQARYCPTCGQATGAVELDPSPADRPDEPAEVTLGAPRRRVLVGVAAVGVAALIVLVAVFNGGSSPSRSATTTVPPPSTPTTVVSSSTTPTSASPPATTVPVAQQVAPHAEAAGVVVYVATSQGDVVRLDLGTGTVQRRTDFDGADQNRGTWLPMGRKGGYVLQSPFDQRSNGAGRTILGVSDDPTSTPAVLQGPSDDNSPGGTQLGPVGTQLSPAAEPDEVWLWKQNQDSSTTVRRMRIDGVVTAGPVTLPRFAFVLGADGPGAVALAGPGGMYRAAVTGTAVDIGPVWPGLLVAYNDRSLLDLTCSGSLDCRLEMVDRASHESRAVSQKPSDVATSPPFETSLSPDGAWLAHVNGPTLTVYDLVGDGTPISHEIFAAAGLGPLGQAAPFAFSPDGRWLVFLDSSDTVELWPVGTPQPPVTITVPGLHGLTALSVAPA